MFRSKLIGLAVLAALIPMGSAPVAQFFGSGIALAPHMRRATATDPNAPVAAKSATKKFKISGVSKQNDGGEPSIAMGLGKWQYVSYPGGPGMAFYYSSNRGKTWKPGAIAEDSSGDTSVNIDSSGAVYESNLRSVSGGTSLEGTVYKSLNHGKTWTGPGDAGDGTSTNNPAHVDREWTDAYIPPQSDTDHAQVYIGYHDFGPGLVWVNASTDGGKTFGQPVNVITDPEAASSSACNTIPGSLKVAQRGLHPGRVFMSWIAADAGSSGATGCNYTQEDTFYRLWVAYSDDQGQTWTDVSVFDGGVTHDMGELFPDMTLDRKGNPYVAVQDNLTNTPGDDGEWDIYVFGSNHSGEEGSWNTKAPTTLGGGNPGDPYKVNVSKGTHYYATIAAGKPGKVDVAWIETDKIQGTTPEGKPVEPPPADMKDAKWNVYMGQTLKLNTAKPRWRITKITKTPIHQGDVCVLGIFCSGFGPAGANRHLLDFIDVAVDRKGYAHIAYTNDLVSGGGIYVARQVAGRSVMRKRRR